MEEKDRVFVRGGWMDADTMLHGFASEGIIPPRKLSAREFKNISNKHSQKQKLANLSPQADVINTIVEEIAQEDSRLDHQFKAVYVNSSVTVLEGNVAPNTAAPTMINSFMVHNRTGSSVFACMSDGQHYQLPHCDERGLSYSYGPIPTVYMTKVLSFPSTSSLRSEYESLQRLKQTQGLCRWKELLLEVMCRLDTNGALIATWIRPMLFTVEFRMSLRDIEKYAIVYDPNTELTFTVHSLNKAIQAHPGHTIERTRQVVQSYLKALDDNQTQVLRVIVRSQPDKRFYQRVNGIVQSLTCVTDIARSNIFDGKVGDVILEEYVEVHVKAGSTYIRDGVSFRPLGGSEDIVLLHRYSIDEAITKRIIFTTPEQADAFGDIQAKEDRMDKLDMKRREAEIEARRQEDKLKYDEIIRQINEGKSQAEADLQKVKLQAELDAIQAKARADEVAREHEKDMFDIKKKMQEAEHQHKIKSDALGNQTQQSKSNAEGFKLFGAALGVVSLVVAAVVKFLPSVLSGVFTAFAFL